MNHFVVSAAIAFTFSFAVSAVAWLKSPPSRLNRILSIYWFSIAFWSFFVGTQPYSIKLLSPFWWGWFLHLGCTFIPVFFFHFTLVFTGREDQKFPRSILTIAYLMTLIFNILNLSTKIFTSEIVYRGAYAYPQPALLYPLYFILFMMLVVGGTYFLFVDLSRLVLWKKASVKFLLLAHLLAYVGGMDNFLIMVDIRLPVLYPYGLYPIPFYSLATTYLIWRFNFFSENSLRDHLVALET